MKNRIEKFKNLPAVARYRTDYEYRTVVRTLLSSAITAAVGTYNLIFGLFAGGNAVWLYTLAAYYYALVAGRVGVLISHRISIKRGEDEDRKNTRNARNFMGGGAWLVLLTLTFSGIIVLVTVGNYHYEYNGITVYIMALYAFWKIISSIVYAVKYEKYGDLTVQTLKIFNIADGIVSVIGLQSALLFAFTAEGEQAFAYTINAVVGGVAVAVMLALGTYMIIRGAKRLKLLSARGKEL